MRSTLFFIPHEVAGVPLFGYGWSLGLLILAAIAWAAWSLAHKQPLAELLAALPVWLVAAAIVIFILPSVELVLPGGEVAGLPVRGYGVMVLLGLAAGISITALRGNQLGIVPDVIIGLGFWMMLGGILGARVFYVVQKWEDYQPLEFVPRLIEIVKLTEGGLVIYGGVVGGLIAGAVFCRINRLNLAATADLIAPGFLLGLAFGRIGCLLHGCCFGGVCTANLPTIRFPAGSVPYNSQLTTGKLLGLDLRDAYHPPATIAEVRPDSLAAAAGIKPGEQLEEVAWGGTGEPASSPTAPPPIRADLIVNGQRTTFMPDQLPLRSLPTHPSQIYASINALLLCLLVWHLQPLPRRDGVVFFVAILLYSLSRFLLEWIRSDEAGQLGTPFTIAQLVAIGSGIVAALALMAILRRPAGRAWNWSKPVKL